MACPTQSVAVGTCFEHGARMTCDQNCFVGFREAAVVDVETTGLSPDRDRIVAVSVLTLDFDEAARSERIEGQTFDALVNPGVPIPKEASRVHGISDADVAGEETFDDIAGRLRDFIGTRPLVGHNVQFDKRFLNTELKRAGQRMLTKNRPYCTQKRFREHMEARYGNRRRFWKLDDLLDELGIEGRASNTHNAAEDVLLTTKAGVLFYSLDNGLLWKDGRDVDTTRRGWPSRTGPNPGPSEPPKRSKPDSATSVSKVQAPTRSASDKGPPGPPKDRPVGQRKPLGKTVAVAGIIGR